MNRIAITGLVLCVLMAAVPACAVPTAAGPCSGSDDCWLGIPNTYWSWDSQDVALDIWLLPNSQVTPSGKPNWAMTHWVDTGLNSTFLSWNLGGAYGTPTAVSAAESFHQLVYRTGGGLAGQPLLNDWTFGNSTDNAWAGQTGTLLVAGLDSSGNVNYTGLWDFDGGTFRDPQWHPGPQVANSLTQADWNARGQADPSATPELGTWMLLACTGLVGLVPRLRRRRQ